MLKLIEVVYFLFNMHQALFLNNYKIIKQKNILSDFILIINNMIYVEINPKKMLYVLLNNLKNY